MNSERPNVVFVCVKNGGKSQMAAALMRRDFSDTVEIHSAGTKPGTALNEESRASVARVGASFDGESPKALDPELVRTADRIVIIGDEATVEPIDGMRGSIETWHTDEPSLRGIEGDERMDLIRDELLERIAQLATELGVSK